MYSTQEEDESTMNQILKLELKVHIVFLFLFVPNFDVWKQLHRLPSSNDSEEEEWVVLAMQN